jgi:hypothetical protein
MSKNLEAGGGFLRMEIFAGTYMRRWFSPCQSSRGEKKRVEMGSFPVLGLFLGFSILVYSAKRYSNFCGCMIRLFTGCPMSYVLLRSLNTGLFTKIALIEKRFLSNCESALSRFRNIPSFEITALIAPRARLTEGEGEVGVF